MREHLPKSHFAHESSIKSISKAQLSKYQTKLKGLQPQYNFGYLPDGQEAN